MQSTKIETIPPDYLQGYPWSDLVCDGCPDSQNQKSCWFSWTATPESIPNPMKVEQIQVKETEWSAIPRNPGPSRIRLTRDVRSWARLEIAPSFYERCALRYPTDHFPNSIDRYRMKPGLAGARASSLRINDKKTVIESLYTLHKLNYKRICLNDKDLLALKHDTGLSRLHAHHARLRLLRLRGGCAHHRLHAHHPVLLGHHATHLLWHTHHGRLLWHAHHPDLLGHPHHGVLLGHGHHSGLLLLGNMPAIIPIGWGSPVTFGWTVDIGWTTGCWNPGIDRTYI